MELNAAHIHLLLNHVPILGFAFGLLFLAWGRWRDSDETIRAVQALFLLVGLTTIVVFLSGENAEDVVEGLAGVSHDAIEVHEETGELAMIVSIVAGLFSGTVLLLHRNRPLPGWSVGGTALVGLIAFGLLAYAGFQGGQVHHEEIRPDGASAPTTEGVEGEGAEGALVPRAPDGVRVTFGSPPGS